MTEKTCLVHFGFLAQKIEAPFSHGSIATLPDFDTKSGAILSLLSNDGYFYPPNKGSEDHLFIVPASHMLTISPDKPEEDVRKGSVAFIIYLLSMLSKSRLQFENWFLDGRIPVSLRGADPILGYPKILGNKVSVAYGNWCKWSTRCRLRFSNILYMFSRAHLYRWDWEIFLHQYIILDACCRMGSDLFRIKGKKDDSAAQQLFRYFEISDPAVVDLPKLASLRNNLFHEAIWADGRPGNVSLLDLSVNYSPGIRLWWLNECLIRSFLNLA